MSDLKDFYDFKLSSSDGDNGNGESCSSSLFCVLIIILCVVGFMTNIG